MWRSLTTQQKVIFILLGLILVSLTYVFFLKTRVPIDELEADRVHRPHSVFPLKNPRKINRQHYIQELHKKLDEKIRPLKRGPPKLFRKNNQALNGISSKRGIKSSIAHKPSIKEIIDGNVLNNQIEGIHKPVWTQKPELVKSMKNQMNVIGKLNQIITDVKNTIHFSSNFIQNKETINILKNISKNIITSKPSTTSEDDKHFNIYHVVDGVRIDPNKEKKEKELLAKYVKINSIDYARNPEKLPVTERQMEVIDACKHAWDGYKKYAWGYDELKPMTMATSQWFMLGLTIVDSLDTLWLLNLKKEYKDGRDWVENELSFGRRIPVNLFETTIRVLGGLLSIFHLTADPMFLEKAVSNVNFNLILNGGLSWQISKQSINCFNVLVSKSILSFFNILRI